MSLIRRCAYCGSIWVCWNWLNYPANFMPKINRHEDGSMTGEVNEVVEWGHECWDCTGVQETTFKVRNGIPYKLLWFYRFFDPFHLTLEVIDKYRVSVRNKFPSVKKFCHATKGRKVYIVTLIDDVDITKLEKRQQELIAMYKKLKFNFHNITDVSECWNYLKAFIEKCGEEECPCRGGGFFEEHISS